MLTVSFLIQRAADDAGLENRAGQYMEAQDGAVQRRMAQDNKFNQ